MCAWILVFWISVIFAECDGDAGAYEKISKLSPDIVIETWASITDLKRFEALTGIDVTNFTDADVARMKSIVQLVLTEHFQHKSIFMKMLDVCTFYNIITFLAVCTFVMFVGFLLKDIIEILALHIGYWIVRLLMNGYILKVTGMIISGILLGYRTAPCSWVRWMFFFGDYTSLLGFITFIATSRYIAGSDRDSRDKHESILSQLMILWIGVGTIATIYHKQWILGVVTVWLLFARCGFINKSVNGGYVFGFEQELDLMNCLTAATVLVPGFIFIRIHVPALYEQLAALETGIMFWGTFIGLLSLLILSDFDYIRSHRVRDKTTPEVRTKMARFMWLQILMVISCVSAMYLGTVLQINCLSTIGGTYLIFWAMDLQRLMTRLLNVPWTLIFFGAFINLIGLRYLLTNYPGYFIIG